MIWSQLGNISFVYHIFAVEKEKEFVVVICYNIGDVSLAYIWIACDCNRKWIPAKQQQQKMKTTSWSEQKKKFKQIFPILTSFAIHTEK